MNFLENLDPIYFRIFFFIIVSFIIYFVIKKVLDYLYPVLYNRNRWYLAKKGGRFLTLIGIVILFLVVFGDRFSNMATIVGLTGTGLAFALREVIVSFAGWIAIMFGDFFKVGDRVLLGGIKGDVINLGAVRTTLMEIGDWVGGDQYNGRIVRVSNSFIFTQPVYNYSADFSYVWDEIKVPVRFGSDTEKVRKILLETACEYIGDISNDAKNQWTMMRKRFQVENTKLEPQVFLVFDDNFIELSLRYLVRFDERRIIRDQLSTRILEVLNKYPNQIEIASETVEVTVQKMKEQHNNSMGNEI